MPLVPPVGCGDTDNMFRLPTMFGRFVLPGRMLHFGLPEDRFIFRKTDLVFRKTGLLEDQIRLLEDQTRLPEDQTRLPEDRTGPVFQ